MLSIKKLNKLYRRFKRDVSGNFSVMASITTLGLFAAAGLSVDAHRAYIHTQNAQSIADSIALAAAQYASNNGTPTTEGDGIYLPGIKYNASDLGFDLKNSETLSFTVSYDNIDRQATVDVESSINPIMLDVLGHDSIATRSNSIARYSELSNVIDAISILFVLDRSGSMSFDDKPLIFDSSDSTEANEIATIDTIVGEAAAVDIIDNYRQPETVRRVSALEGNLATFNAQLAALEASNTTGSRALRMGLITYNNIAQVIQPMEWGALNLNTIAPTGGTNSGSALAQARNEMLNEDDRHLTESGNDDPLKFVILMSDGQNSGTPSIWQAQSGTGQFRIQTREYCYNFFNQSACNSSFPSTRFTILDIDIIREWKGDDGIQHPNDVFTGNFEEGREFSASDVTSFQNCDQMKAQGITIFTIGFALETGDFATNDWGNPNNTTLPPSNRTRIVNVNNDGIARARNVLSRCASDQSTFLLANDASQLTLAFNRIQRQIADQVVRLSNASNAAKTYE